MARPKAGATGIARAAPIDAVEALSQSGDVLGIDADASILDGKFGTLRGRVPADADGAASRGVAHGVGHQVAEGADQFGFRTAQIAPPVGFDDDGVTVGRQCSASRRSLSSRLASCPPVQNPAAAPTRSTTASADPERWTACAWTGRPSCPDSVAVRRGRCRFPARFPGSRQARSAAYAIRAKRWRQSRGACWSRRSVCVTSLICMRRRSPA
jgi:hypothetical protein